jgi:hypothetical protein
MLQLVVRGEDYGRSPTIDRINTILAPGVENSELKHTFCWWSARERILTIECCDRSSNIMGQKIKRLRVSMNDTIQSNFLPASPRCRREDALHAGVS